MNVTRGCGTDETDTEQADIGRRSGPRCGVDPDLLNLLSCLLYWRVWRWRFALEQAGSIFIRPRDRRGYHVSYLGYLSELLKQHFGVIDSPDDENPFTLVIRITPAGTERYELKGEYHYFTPLDSVLYAGHNDQHCGNGQTPILKRQVSRNRQG